MEYDTVIYIIDDDNGYKTNDRWKKVRGEKDSNERDARREGIRTLDSINGDRKYGIVLEVIICFYFYPDFETT